jgi:hypothetical protein
MDREKVAIFKSNQRRGKREGKKDKYKKNNNEEND